MNEVIPSCCSGNKIGQNNQSGCNVIFEMSNINIPEVTSKLTREDITNGWKARWGINRMRNAINPGLYKIGKPDDKSPVLVTANYKLTFDKLRKELSDIDAWILVLDTKGINVWCAAGKGTFGTRELIKRIQLTHLHNIVSHRKIILPQLGAPGVAAHTVKDFTDFTVVYGPIYAKDIRAYIQDNFHTSPEMRKVRFNFIDRMVLIPIELKEYMKIVPIIFAALFILQIFSENINVVNLLIDSIPFISTIFIGAVLGPLLLPWIPFRAFSLKGWLLGITFTLFYNYFMNINLLNQISNILIIPAITAFIVVNFTGATTFTSLSGVKKELKYALPLIIITLTGGIGFKIADIFV